MATTATEICKQRFFALVLQLQGEQTLAEKWWPFLQSEQSKPYRYYHTLNHIADLLQKLDTFPNICNKHNIELAIFFHDLIYEPKSATNEEDSAKHFVQFASEAQLQPQTIETVQRYILQTKHHLQCQEKQDTDMLAFLDLDLSILGSDVPLVYDTYASNVRQEYIHYNDAQFQNGRSTFLKSMQNRSLYFTAYGQVTFEQLAQQNMARELAACQQHKIVE